ncbi:MAG: hypothetical protein ACTS27_08090 [Phycisphaerales bacterium]
MDKRGEDPIDDVKKAKARLTALASDVDAATRRGFARRKYTYLSAAVGAGVALQLLAGRKSRAASGRGRR